jgi:hypothetical protein
MTSKAAWPKVAVLFGVSGPRRLLVQTLVSIVSRHGYECHVGEIVAVKRQEKHKFLFILSLHRPAILPSEDWVRNDKTHTSGPPSRKRAGPSLGCNSRGRRRHATAAPDTKTLWRRPTEAVLPRPRSGNTTRSNTAKSRTDRASRKNVLSRNQSAREFLLRTQA